jgi:hypothetical protein
MRSEIHSCLAVRAVTAIKSTNRAQLARVAAAGFACFLMLASYNVWTYRCAPVGIVERVPVYSILAWQVLSAVLILTRPAGRDDG